MTIWKGIIIGALIGSAMLVFGGQFKGNLGESEFLAGYIGYLTPATALGAFIGWRKQRREAPEQPPPKYRAFIIAIVLLSVAVFGKVAIDFPNGEGLFHPTHAANVAEVKKVCLQKLATDSTDTQETKEAYCACWADQVAPAAEMSSPPPIQLVAQKADAACRK
jgi:hypothetical protein